MNKPARYPGWWDRWSFTILWIGGALTIAFIGWLMGSEMLMFLGGVACVGLGDQAR